jgi:hypothetical protein
MKKLFYLLNGLLLTAALAACSSEYDDPPEQPNSHQNEVSVDSVDITQDEGAAKDYTVISTIHVSEEVKAFFDEALPMVDEYFNNISSDSVYFNLEPERDELSYFSYVVINNKEEMENRYLGLKELPQIDFNKYTIIIGDCLLGNSTILSSFSIEVNKYCDHNELVIKTSSRTRGHGGCAHTCFWGVFPKINGYFTSYSWKEIVIKNI